MTSRLRGRLPIRLVQAHTMLTITIIFAILVAVWGFSGSIAGLAKRSLTHVTPRPRPVRTRTPATQRPRTSRPIAPAGR